MADQLQLDCNSCFTSGSSHWIGTDNCRSFCTCVQDGKGADCQCGEDQMHLDWTWDPSSTTSDAHLQHEGKEVIFHPNYSSGTAAIRSTESLSEGQHYWEVKMSTPVYGTDMMVGVGTSEARLNHLANKFHSLLGEDEESWGLSYQGTIHHNGQKERYTANRLGQGSIIGLYLDSWLGHLSFYLNRQPLGLAFDGLRHKQLFPIITSTAARSGMKVITTQSHKTSLFFMCAKTLRKHVPHDKHVADVLPLPPGLVVKLRQKLDWLLRPHPDPSHERQALKSPHACSKCNNSNSYFGTMCEQVEENTSARESRRMGTSSRWPAPVVRTSDEEGSTGDSDGQSQSHAVRGRRNNLDDPSLALWETSETWPDRTHASQARVPWLSMSQRARCSRNLGPLPCPAQLDSLPSLPGYFSRDSPTSWRSDDPTTTADTIQAIPTINSRQLLSQLIRPSPLGSSQLRQGSRNADISVPVCLDPAPPNRKRPHDEIVEKAKSESRNEIETPDLSEVEDETDEDFMRGSSKIARQSSS